MPIEQNATHARETEYLRHWILAVGVEADLKKVRTKLEWPIPQRAFEWTNRPEIIREIEASHGYTNHSRPL